MKLLSSPASPFGCKTKLARHLMGLENAIDVELVDTIGLQSDSAHPNPLGKIPCLITDDGRAVFDSFVICDFLARTSGSDWWMPESSRDDNLINHALITGATEAALLLVYEQRMRPEDTWNANWMSMQQLKIDQALEQLEAGNYVVPTQPRMDSVALASLLGYLDLRFQGQWRTGYPNLVLWLGRFSDHVPVFEQLKPH